MVKRRKEDEADEAIDGETGKERLKHRKSFVATVRSALKWKMEVKAEVVLWTCSFCTRRSTDRLDCEDCRNTFCSLCLLTKDKMVCFDCNDRAKS